jgi:hypothetical protein
MGKTQPALSHHLDQVPEAGPLNCHEHGSCDAIAGLEGPLLLAVRNSHSVSRIRADRNSSDEKVGIHHRVSIRIDIWWSASVCPGSSDQLEVSPLLEALPAQERKWDCPALPIALRQLWFAQWAPLIPLGIPAEIRQISASKRRPEPAQFIHHFLLPGSACTRPRDQ